MDFKILGPLEVTRAGQPLDLGSPRQRAVLARLLLNPNQVVSTDRLIEDLWDGDPPKSAKHSLHVYVSGLRKAFGDERARLVHEGSGYRLDVSADELDADLFESMVAAGRAALGRGDPESAAKQLSAALDLWRGPPLVEIADETFARDSAVRLEELRQTALEQRLWADLECGRHGEVVEELRDLTTRYPFREEFWEQLMIALYRGGRQAEALRVYQTIRTTLAEELGIEPGPALRSTEERILAQDPTLRSYSSDPADTASGLPVPRTSFIGREAELALGGQLLERTRLLTLTGAPGTGKTRLGIRLARLHEDRYPQGTFFVPLASVTDAELFPATLARALGVRETTQESAIDEIATFLRSRRALLVLDNFEQILGAAPQVGELLDAAPGVDVIVTSRASLGIAGEQEMPVPPLQVPTKTDIDTEDLAAVDAVTLFVARAQATDPQFELTPHNAEAVIAITSRLDGLPLALELAAARIKVLTPHDLATALDQRLTMLADGPLDIEDRHRTIRDAIAWSYELLEPADQRLFCQLGVFVGGFDLDAVAAVSDLTDAEALERTGHLVAQSLLFRPSHMGRSRLAMLEMTREFAQDMAVEEGQADETARRHARYYLALADQLEPELTRDPEGGAMVRLAPEVANIRAALAQFLAEGAADLGLGLASRVWRFWQSSDQLIEGRQWLEQLLEHPAATDEARADGLSAMAGLAYWMADYDAALGSYEAALELYRSRGDRLSEADTLYAMSLTAGWNDELDRAKRLADDSRTIFEELASADGVGRALIAQAFAIWKQGELESAKKTWEEALQVVKDSGDRALATTALVGLASLTFQLGDRVEATRIILDGLGEALHAHNNHVAVWMLDFVAAFAASEDPKAAVRLAGAVDVLRKDAGGGIMPESLGVEDARTVASGMLGPEAVSQAWTQGGTMDLDQSVDAAFELGKLIASA